MVCVVWVRCLLTKYSYVLLALIPQGTEKENLWDSNKDLRLSMFEEQTPLFSCVFYILFRKRKKRFWHCYLQGTTVRLGVQACTACSILPKWGVSGSPLASPVYLCVSRLSHTMKLVTPGVTLLQHKAAAPSWALQGTRTILSLSKSVCVGVAHLAMSKERAQFCFVEEAFSNSHICGLDQVWSRTNGECHISLWHPDPHVCDQKHWIFLIVPHIGERSGQCRQDPLSWHHGHKKPSKYHLLV